MKNIHKGGGYFYGVKERAKYLFKAPFFKTTPLLFQNASPEQLKYEVLGLWKRNENHLARTIEKHKIIAIVKIVINKLQNINGHDDLILHIIFISLLIYLSYNNELNKDYCKINQGACAEDSLDSRVIYQTEYSYINQINICLSILVRAIIFYYEKANIILDQEKIITFVNNNLSIIINDKEVKIIINNSTIDVNNDIEKKGVLFYLLPLFDELHRVQPITQQGGIMHKNILFIIHKSSAKVKKPSDNAKNPKNHYSTNARKPAIKSKKHATKPKKPSIKFTKKPSIVAKKM